MPFRIREFYSTNGAQHTSPGATPWVRVFPESRAL